MRQIHHWAALLFLGAILVHLLRIFFTGAFRRPREINWVVGLTPVAARRSPTGSPATAFPTTCSRAPACGSRTRCWCRSRLLGPWLAFLVFGGEFPSDDIIPRLFVIHVLDRPRADRRAAHRCTSRCSSARSTRSSRGAAAPNATSSARSCGRRSPPRHSACSSSCSRCAPRSAAWRRSTRSGCTGRSSRRR